MAGFARVQLDTPLPGLDRLFDYRIPEKLGAVVRPGVRVKVPFGTRKTKVQGFVITLHDSPSSGFDYAEIADVISPVPVLTAPVWRLARAVADRQGGTVADVLRLAIPPRLARAEKRIVGQFGDEVFAPSAPLDLSGSDREIASPQQATIKRAAITVAGGGRFCNDDSNRKSEPSVSARTAKWHPTWAISIAEATVAKTVAGRQSIVVVPDFRDLNVIDAALAEFAPGSRVLRFGPGEDADSRYDAFLRILAGEVDVVIGNRSAAYAPVADLGLIAIWDDGDPALAEPLAPYAHARDVALLRQQQSGADLMILSHSQSTAVARLVQLGYFVEERVGEVPKMIVAGQFIEVGSPAGGTGLPSAAWRMMQDTLDSGGQVLLQTGRTGYSRSLLCKQCGTPARCQHCGGPLAIAAAGAIPTCRWCSKQVVGFSCSVCAGRDFKQASPGVDRTAEDIGKAFPGVKVVVSSGDRLVERVGPGKAIVLATAGTEPIPDTGGFGFVGLLDCSWMLGRESLTVVEDSLRQWLHAAALADPARGTVVAVGIEGRLARAFNTWNPEMIAREELNGREDLGFPPARRICEVIGPIGTTEAWIFEAGVSAEIQVVGTASIDDKSERTLITLAYRVGGKIAAALKAQAIRTGSRSQIRYRFDDMSWL